jgi:hypothetical protein
VRERKTFEGKESEEVDTHMRRWIHKGREKDLDKIFARGNEVEIIGAYGLCHRRGAQPSNCSKGNVSEILWSIYSEMSTAREANGRGAGRTRRVGKSQAVVFFLNWRRVREPARHLN